MADRSNFFYLRVYIPRQLQRDMDRLQARYGYSRAGLIQHLVREEMMRIQRRSYEDEIG